jgi:hypothetical protein
MINGSGAVNGMKTGRGNRSTRGGGTHQSATLYTTDPRVIIKIEKLLIQNLYPWICSIFVQNSYFRILR